LPAFVKYSTNLCKTDGFLVKSLNMCQFFCHVKGKRPNFTDAAAVFLPIK
jgi:hypothetical protein